MQDERGLYYYPNPAQRATRMYVRLNDGAIEFRLYNSQAPEIWERHGWLPLEVVKQAAALYQGEKDPTSLYDEKVARNLLESAAEDS